MNAQQPYVVIPNLNGGDELLAAIASLHKQSLKPHIIVVDNASTDGSAERAQKQYPDVEFVWHKKNKGYAGGVNPGLQRAIDRGASYVAPFNDDATADPDWLKHLVNYLDAHPQHGAACCKVLKSDGKHLDSTGDFLTIWGLPYPRGRDEVDTGQYDDKPEIFAASGAASLFRVETLRKVGLFDESFFAYYEDVDLGFRMQNAGWKVGYVPESIVYHAVGMTSGRIKGFTTYQTLKNLPLLIWKNVPFLLLFRVLPRFSLAYLMFYVRAWMRGQGWAATKGVFMSVFWLAWKLPDIMLLETKRKLSAREVWALLTHDLPPNARALRALRSKWRRLTFRGANDA